MTPIRSLAAAQTVPVRGDVAANIVQHIELARAAAQQAASVLVYPELSLTGYELELAAELAFSEGDARLQPLREAACEGALTLIVGAPMRISSRLHIGAFILYPDGRLALHTKRHLGAFSPDVSENGIVPPAENTIFEPGTSCPLVELADGNAVVAICGESLQPWVAKEAHERGTKAYLSGHFAIPSDVERRLSWLAQIAAQYELAVVFASPGGPSGTLPGSGSSAIISQRGELLIRLPARGVGIAVAHEHADDWRAESIMLTHG